jgi:adhesin HecA-like repeat protein
VGGGAINVASGGTATVSGGVNNSASGINATVPGGAVNVAAGISSFAAGNQAKANHDGSFVWADSQVADMASTAADQFIARAQGRFFLQSDSTLDNQGGFLNTSTGAFLSTGGTWTNSSDENLKQGFAALDPSAVLAKVTALPIKSWSYKAEPGVRHVGPVAQDFYRAFGLGTDDRHIASVDSDGVALAAIQGLNDKVAALEHQRPVAATTEEPALPLGGWALLGALALVLALGASAGAALALRWTRPRASALAGR